MASWWSRIRQPQHDVRSFDAVVLPHLNAGYNLARWLLHDDASAEDAVQEAAMRALHYFDSLRGDDARKWFLAIVRNTCWRHLEKAATKEQTGWQDDELESLQELTEQVAPDTAQLFDRAQQRLRVNTALRALPPPLREVIVLRELEEMNYTDIAKIADIPVGTVMSRLSRARARLRLMLAEPGVSQ